MYSCLLFFSLLNGIDPALTQSIITVESKGNPKAIGSVGERGLMQIRPEFVPETALQLMQPCTNIRRGTKLLSEIKKKYGGIDNSFVICYNLGMTGCKKIKHPRKFAYYKKVMDEYRKISQL